LWWNPPRPLPLPSYVWPRYESSARAFGIRMQRRYGIHASARESVNGPQNSLPAAAHTQVLPAAPRFRHLIITSVAPVTAPSSRAHASPCLPSHAEWAGTPLRTPWTGQPLLVPSVAMPKRRRSPLGPLCRGALRSPRLFWAARSNRAARRSLGVVTPCATSRCCLAGLAG